MRLSLHLLLLLLIIQWSKVKTEESSEEENVEEKLKEWQEKYPDFCVGCHVRLSSDKELAIKLQPGHGGWTNSMKKLLGQVGKIESVDSDGDVDVRFDGYDTNDTVLLNPDAIHPVSKEEVFCKGCQVRLRDDAELVEEKQKEKDLESEIDSELLGETGKVVSVTGDGDVVIDFEDRDVPEMTFNPVLLLPVNNVFCVGCNVTFNADKESYVRRKQKGHGGWKDEMKEVFGKVGVVQGTDSDGDVRVTFKGNLTFMLNPELLSIEEDDEEKRDPRFCTGCYVRLSTDEELVRKELSDHGEWVKSLKQFLGKIAKIDATDADGDIIATFGQYGADNTYVFKPTVLTPVDESEVDWPKPCVGCHARVHRCKSYVLCEQRYGEHFWNNIFGEVMGRIGLIESFDNETDVIEIQFDGMAQPFIFDAEVVEPVTLEEAFCVGCTVRLHSNRDVIMKKLEIEESKIYEYEKVIGRSGVVLKTYSDGKVAVHFFDSLFPMLWDHTLLFPYHNNVCDGLCNVTLSSDKELVKRKQKIVGSKWDDSMEQFLGQIGRFIGTTTSGNALVALDKHRVEFNPELLTIVPIDRQLVLNSMVQVHTDKYFIREKQNKFGGFPESMEKLLGAVGYVTKVDSDGGILVNFPWHKTSFRFNPVLLTRIFNGEAFYKGSTVRLHSNKNYVIKKQENITNGWNSNMINLLGSTGTVEDRKNGVGVILVKFNDGQFYPFHPDTLQPVPTDVETLHFCQGCRVTVIDDLDFIKQQRKPLNLYSDYVARAIKMALGKTGIIVPIEKMEGYIYKVQFPELGNMVLSMIPQALKNASEPVFSDIED